MKNNNCTQFKIQHLDPNAQGVHKENQDIYFIKKTLPDETGTCEIISSSKGVNFAKLTHLDHPSADRITPDCPHFNECPGCDFRHTSYQNELTFKKQSLYKIFQKIIGPEFPLEIKAAPSRTDYRNRLQLHYDLNLKKIGFIGLDRQILPIQNCLIASSAIQLKLKELLTYDSWFHFLSSQRAARQGHIELYEKSLSEPVIITQNQPYAASGFTQVNPAMNLQLKNLVKELTESEIIKSKITFLVDLFGGNGNLTSPFSIPSFVFDQYDSKSLPKAARQTFHSLNLYSPVAISAIKKNIPKGKMGLIIDPPRSGLKNLNEFLEEFSPEFFLYIACDPQSLARDISTVNKNYLFEKLVLCDLFPGTKHYETIALFTKIEKSI